MTIQRVLCVDDDPQVLSGLTRSLRKVCPVATAPSGQEALELLRRDRDFAVIISDMRMPMMDGARFLEDARLLVPDAVRVLLTGEADLSAVVRAVNAGHIHHYLQKPLEQETLVQLVGRAFVENAEASEQRQHVRQAVLAGLQLGQALTGGRAPQVAAHVERTAELAVRLAERLGLSDLGAVSLAARGAVLSRQLPRGSGRALLSNLFAENPSLGGAREAVLELWDEVPDGRRSVMARVVSAAMAGSELREVEWESALAQTVDARILEAMRSLAHAA